MVRAIDIEEPFEAKKEQTRHTTRSIVAICAGIVVVGTIAGCYVDAGNLSTRSKLSRAWKDYKKSRAWEEYTGNEYKGNQQTWQSFPIDQMLQWQNPSNFLEEKPRNFPVDHLDVINYYFNENYNMARFFLINIKSRNAADAGQFFSYKAKSWPKSTPDSKLVNVDGACKDGHIIENRKGELQTEIKEALEKTQAPASQNPQAVWLWSKNQDCVLGALELMK